MSQRYLRPSTLAEDGFGESESWCVMVQARIYIKIFGSRIPGKVPKHNLSMQNYLKGSKTGRLSLYPRSYSTSYVCVLYYMKRVQLSSLSTFLERWLPGKITANTTE